MHTDEGVAPRHDERDRADLSVEAPGARETGSVPWPLLLQQRMSAHVQESDRYRWLVLFTALFLAAASSVAAFLSVSYRLPSGIGQTKKVKNSDAKRARWRTRPHRRSRSCGKQPESDRR